jgi:hypothetical protein
MSPDAQLDFDVAVLGASGLEHDDLHRPSWAASVLSFLAKGSPMRPLGRCASGVSRGLGAVVRQAHFDCHARQWSGPAAIDVGGGPNRPSDEQGLQEQPNRSTGVGIEAERVLVSNELRDVPRKHGDEERANDPAGPP